MSGFQGAPGGQQIPPQVMQMLIARMAQQRQMQQQQAGGGMPGAGPSAGGMPGGPGPLQGGPPPMAGGPPMGGGGPMGGPGGPMPQPQQGAPQAQPPGPPMGGAPMGGAPGGGRPPMTPHQMASQGRFGDQIVAHVAPGEMMIPPEMQQSNPQLMQMLAQAFQRSGISPAQFTAGAPQNSLNPNTGMPEYSLWGALLPIAGAAVGSVVPGIGTAAGAALGGAVGGAAGSAIDGGNAGQIALGAAGGGAGGYIGGGGLSGIAEGAAGAGAGAAEDAAAAQAADNLAMNGPELASSLGSASPYSGAAGAFGTGGAAMPVTAMPNVAAADGAATAGVGAPPPPAFGGGAGTPAAPTAAAQQAAAPNTSGVFGGLNKPVTGVPGSTTYMDAGKIGLSAGVGASLAGLASPIEPKSDGKGGLNDNPGPNLPANNPNFNSMLGNSNSSTFSGAGYNPYAVASGQAPFNFYSPNGNGR